MNAATLLVLGGDTVDLAIEASCVTRVIERREAGASEPIDLFALLKAQLPSGQGQGRVVVASLADGRELLIAAPGTLTVTSPPAGAVLPLPRIVTRRVPWLEAVVLDGGRPLLLVAPERIGRAPATVPNSACLW